MPKFGKSINEKPSKAKRRNLKNVAPSDDDPNPEKSRESLESNQSEGLDNPMTSMISRQSSRFLAEFQIMVDGCRQDVGNLLLEKISDIAQQATSEEAAYISAATENLAGQDLSKTAKGLFHPDQQVSQTLLSSASKLIEEYETFCEEITSIIGSKETFADWDDEYCRFASVFNRQRNVTRHWIRVHLDKKFASSKGSSSTGGRLAPEEPVWRNMVESMEINEQGSIEDDWAVATSRVEREVQNLVKVLRD